MVGAEDNLRTPFLPEFSVHAELSRAAVSGSVLQQPLVQFTHISVHPMDALLGGDEPGEILDELG
jgi:hypothetical protein